MSITWLGGFFFVIIIVAFAVFVFEVFIITCVVEVLSDVEEVLQAEGNDFFEKAVSGFNVFIELIFFFVGIIILIIIVFVLMLRN
jgi:hypothetical protein